MLCLVFSSTCGIFQVIWMKIKPMSLIFKPITTSSRKVKLTRKVKVMTGWKTWNHFKDLKDLLWMILIAARNPPLLQLYLQVSCPSLGRFFQGLGRIFQRRLMHFKMFKRFQDIFVFTFVVYIFYTYSFHFGKTLADYMIRISRSVGCSVIIKVKRSRERVPRRYVHHKRLVVYILLIFDLGNFVVLVRCSIWLSWWCLSTAGSWCSASWIARGANAGRYRREGGDMNGEPPDFLDSSTCKASGRKRLQVKTHIEPDQISKMNRWLARQSTTSCNRPGLSQWRASPLPQKKSWQKQEDFEAPNFASWLDDISRAKYWKIHGFLCNFACRSSLRLFGCCPSIPVLPLLRCQVTAMGVAKGEAWKLHKKSPTHHQSVDAACTKRAITFNMPCVDLDKFAYPSYRYHHKVTPEISSPGQHWESWATLRCSPVFTRWFGGGKVAANCSVKKSHHAALNQVKAKVC